MPEITQPPFPQVTAASAAAVLGVSLLLYWLEIQMAEDCEHWCELKIGEVHDLDELELAAGGMLGTLTRASSNAHLKQKLQSDYDAIRTAVSKARHARDYSEPGEAEEQAFIARQALLVMLGRAYKWGYTNSVVMTSWPGQQPRAGIGAP